VVAHGGAIRVESAPGAGSTFHVLLPLHRGEQGTPAAAIAALPLPAGDGQHVLYVDDDELMLLLVERLLQKAGYRATCVGNGCAAIETLRSTAHGRFDLVVTDFNMPDCSGLDVADAALKAEPPVPVVISSGHLSDELRQAAQALGVQALLQKQNTLEELPGIVQRVLAGARQAAAASAGP